ncbi:PREDICTED: natural cytotoxicity triggering receptor 2 [Chrysochloris asiatica]|uniref:Natural cytotoxicity triggering receptor 2 n=1 Tax=Chrysochloris asiatica TaxID=185453 RepID=A0A9B0TDS8_CHRAS|nr:PREDICTED: natural cytotoxicity triggering receptor 2 [Chrysochloris asiatica]
MKSVSRSQPWTLTQNLRFTIWDNRNAGFFTVTMIAPSKTSSRSPPRVLSTASTRATCNRVSAQTPGSLVPIGRANTTVPSQQQNSNLSSGVLGSMLCGILSAALLIL